MFMRRASCAGAEDRERSLRRAEGRRARLHRKRRDERPEHHRRAGPDELAEGGAGHHFGEHLRQRAATVTGLIAPDRMKGVTMQA